jgi:hypothetical protein
MSRYEDDGICSEPCSQATKSEIKVLEKEMFVYVGRLFSKLSSQTIMLWDIQ